MIVPLPALIDMTVVWNGCRWRIIVRGELDLRSGRELEDVAGVLDPMSGVDIDLKDITFIDSAGWQAVTAARRRVQSAGGVSDLVGVSPAVNRYLDLVGAASTVPAADAPRRPVRGSVGTRCSERRRRPQSYFVGPT